VIKPPQKGWPCITDAAVAAGCGVRRCARGEEEMTQHKRGPALADRQTKRWDSKRVEEGASQRQAKLKPI
jgi:hypothetical protein